jgi:hypothetical protein
MTNKNTKETKNSNSCMSDLKKAFSQLIPFWKIETKTIKMAQTHATSIRQ